MTARSRFRDKWMVNKCNDESKAAGLFTDYHNRQK